jgi:tRNA(Ile)-lysidine synthase
MKPEMLNEFKRFIAVHNLVTAGDKILVAVSGGVDSMVMTQLFLELGYNIGLAHCNFSLRGRESDNDEKMVSKYATDHNIPFFSTRFDTKTYARKKGLSVQMAARELRYSWFEEIRMNNEFNSVAVAHNLNDNIETLIINLVRGTGLTGLTGMKPKNNNIIRPMLFATREEIMLYCKEHQIIYREDKSNAETKYTRNKIRHRVIPVLKEINPSIEMTLSETAERFAGINDIVSEFIHKLRDKITEHKEDMISFNISLLRPHLKNRATVYELFKPFGVTNMQLNDLIKVINGKTGNKIYTETHRLLKNRKEIIVSPEQSKNDLSFFIKKINGLNTVPGIISAEYVNITDSFEIPSDQSVACIDSEKMTFPVNIRKWKPGDNFIPLGMKQKKKLSDYFIDNKYSILEKENKYILESEGKIVWIIGDRIDNRFRITRSTKRALIIKSAKKALIIKPLR